MTLSLPGTTEMREAGPLSPSDVAETAWGSCQIRLVADRVASHRTGSTHKVYRGWRFAVAMDQGHPDSGTAGSESVPLCPGAAREPGHHHRWRYRGLLLVHHIDRDGRSLRRGVSGGASPPGGRRLDAGRDGPGVLHETSSDAGGRRRAAWVGDGRRHVRLSTGSDRPTRSCDDPGSAAQPSAP
jgi:hypothetical protein